MKITECIKWFTAGIAFTLTVAIAVNTLASSPIDEGWMPSGRREETITVTFDDIFVGIRSGCCGHELINMRNRRREVVEAFVYDGLVYAPVRPIAEALGARYSWNPENSSIVSLLPHACPPVPKIEGNTITVPKELMIGYLHNYIDLPVSASSGVTWEVVSISSDLVTYVGSESITSNETLISMKTDAAIRFILGFSMDYRRIPNNFTVTFEQVLDGKPLGNFCIFEISMI